MSKASSDQCLINAIIKEGKIPEEWNNSYIVCSKVKLEHWTEGHHVLKVVERVLEKIIRECIVIDDMQFGFMSGLVLSSLSDNFKKNFWTKIKTFISGISRGF